MPNGENISGWIEQIGLLQSILKNDLNNIFTDFTLESYQ